MGSSHICPVVKTADQNVADKPVFSVLEWFADCFPAREPPKTAQIGNVIKIKSNILITSATLWPNSYTSRIPYACQ